MASWKNRIVGHADVPPDQLLANPANWRIHPESQQRALEGVLDQIGLIASVIVNITTQHVIDGHLRVALAISRNEPTVPVDYVELTVEEERLALATFDPLGALAAKDDIKITELVGAIATENQAVQALLSALTKPTTMEKVEFEAVKDCPKCPTCGQKLKKGATLPQEMVTT